MELANIRIEFNISQTFQPKGKQMNWYIQYSDVGNVRFLGPFPTKEAAESNLRTKGFQPVGQCDEWSKGVSEGAFVVSEEDYRVMMAV